MLRNPVEYFWSLCLVLHMLYNIPEATSMLRFSEACTYQPSHQCKLFLHCKPWCACARRHSEGMSHAKWLWFGKNNSPSYNPQHRLPSEVPQFVSSSLSLMRGTESQGKATPLHLCCAHAFSQQNSRKEHGFFGSSGVCWFWMQLYSIPTAGMPATLQSLFGNPVHLP